MHENAENSRCLNDDELIGNYVCPRRDAASLIGDGISAVWGLFLFSSDPNTRQHNVPGRHFGWVLEGVDGRAARFDWVLERVDGTAAQIHPISNAHGTPVMAAWSSGRRPKTGTPPLLQRGARPC